MGTRGVMGVVIDDTEKITYNHFDSYPDGLGTAILEVLRTQLADDPTLAELRRQAKSAALVDEEQKPTAEQQRALAEYHDSRVSTGSTEEWYSLLRNTQGDLAATLACGFIIDSHDFPLDSLFCEWGYVVDLDRNVLEVYEGFQTKVHDDGRFAERNPEGEYKAGINETYYPIRLVATYPLDALPNDDAFTRELEVKEAEDD